MDVKKVGRIHDGGGWRANGRAMGSAGERKRAKIRIDYITLSSTTTLLYVTPPL